MIKLEFGEFAVNMANAVELDAALLADFESGFDLNEAGSTSGQRRYDVQGGGNSARIEMVGTFHNPVESADSVDILTIFNHEDVFVNGTGTSRLIVSGPPALQFGTVFDDFLNSAAETRDISVLYQGQQVEIHGSNGFGDTLIGDELGDSLFGEGGNDSLFGLNGNDTLNGGAGTDSMAGGAGNDVYFTSSKADVVFDESGTSDTVKSAVTEILVNGDGIERLTLIGANAINGTGNTSANLLTGNASNNVLNGKGGADTLSGGGGNDTLVWGTPDFFDGGGGSSDKLRVDGAGNTVNLQTAPASKVKNVEIVDLTGSGNNQLLLTSADVLSSNTDTLRILGNAGDIVHRGTGWSGGGISGGFRTYTRGDATLLVDADITSLV